MYFHIPDGFMLILVLVVIPSVFPHEITAMGKERSLGALIGGALGAVLVIAVHTWLPAALIAMLVILLFSYSFCIKVLHYAMVMGLITFAASYYMAYQDNAVALTFVVHWVGLIFLGLIMLLVINALIAPDYPRESWRKHWKALLNQLIEETRNPTLSEQSWRRFWKQNENLFTSASGNHLLTQIEMEQYQNLMPILKSWWLAWLS